MKKVIAVGIIILLLCFSNMAIAANEIKIFVNGKQVYSDVPAFILNGRTMVPVRLISEIVDANVTWDDNTKAVYVSKGENTVKLIVGGKAYKNNIQTEIDVPAKIIKGRTFVPLRFIGEALQLFVYWDNNSQEVNVVDKPKLLNDIHLEKDGLLIKVAEIKKVADDARKRAEDNYLTERDNLDNIKSNTARNINESLNSRGLANSTITVDKLRELNIYLDPYYQEAESNRQSQLDEINQLEDELLLELEARLKTLEELEADIDLLP